MNNCRRCDGTGREPDHVNSPCCICEGKGKRPQAKKLLRKKVIKVCCKSLHQKLNHECSEHGFNCPDHPIRFYTTFSGAKPEFGICHPDNVSYYTINNCPWCGTELKQYLADSYDGYEMIDL